MNSKHDCPWGCGPLIHDTRRETICILGHTIERMATGWWCDKCGEVVLGGADLAASEAATAERPKLMHLALDGAIGDLEVYAPEAAAHHTAKLAELYAS